jgi:hypothetical protein
LKANYPSLFGFARNIDWRYMAFFKNGKEDNNGVEVYAGKGSLRQDLK